MRAECCPLTRWGSSADYEAKQHLCLEKDFEPFGVSLLPRPRGHGLFPAPPALSPSPESLASPGPGCRMSELEKFQPREPMRAESIKARER